MTRIMIVDDDPLARKILARMLSPGHQVEVFGNGEEALAHYSRHGADLVLTDLKMPRMGGLDLLKAIKHADPDATVFVITGHSSLESAVTAVKMGAYDYIAKPFDPDDVLVRINRALKERRLEKTVDHLLRERERENLLTAPLTRNPAMLEMLELARKAARTDSSVLILGETGVGKEVVARAIHNWSPRREQPFLAVNCGALAEGVLESELFGHEKGAFSGAVASRAGYFELASTGTLFLDEIGTTQSSFQVKLLRVLQEKTICRVGSGRPVAVDDRIISASNQDLLDESRRGLFRSDLYYRLSVITLHVPPLRERPEDIPLLADHFLRLQRQVNPRIAGISDEGLRQLASYDFPGNVRELENIIERAMIIEPSPLLTPDSLLVGNVAGQAPNIGPGATMEDAEREHILKVLQRCEGRKLEAARVLGINKTTLWRKMKRYGLA